MRLPYSFIIPVRNEQRVIGPLLADLRQRFADCELVVVDGNSTDRSSGEALRLADVVLIAAPGRAAQMNLGAASARGDYFIFLHADTRPEFTLDALCQTLDAAPSWGFCRVRLSGTQSGLRLVEAGMNLRSRLTAVATGDQMLFVSRALFDAVDGYAGIPLMEDVELCKRLRRIVRPCLPKLTVCTSSRRWEQRGLVRTVLRMWWLRLLYVCGVSPRRLWQIYYG